MRQTPETRKTCSLLVLLFPSLLSAQAQRPPRGPDAIEGPDKAMMQHVIALVKYMEHVSGAVLPPVFAPHELMILEDFAPYVFRGNDAAALWDAGFRNHAARLSDLHCALGPPHDFGRSGNRVYFVLPTTWRGVYLESRRFEEHGAWSFVLQESSGKWRILAYGWGATDRTDVPAVASH